MQRYSSRFVITTLSSTVLRFVILLRKKKERFILLRMTGNDYLIEMEGVCAKSVRFDGIFGKFDDNVR